MEDIVKDFMREKYTRRDIVKYGVLYPIGLMAACMIAEMLNTI